MDKETNLELIRALEKRIEEDKGDTIELKRARNSLLNISVRLPPEILGRIFTWCVAWKQDCSVTQVDYTAPGKLSYNFLLVCHHWYEVASNTPELWSYWGNTLEDWHMKYRRTGAATPVDLVLKEYISAGKELSKSLQGALIERATQDKIRRIQLEGGNSLLTPILSLLTPDGKGVRENHVESIVLWAWSTPPRLTNFFAQSRFPKLQHLYIRGPFRTLPWEHLALHTGRLTTLKIKLTGVPRLPTLPQIISVLASNPGLRELSLSGAALPEDTVELGIRVSLCHLKGIKLKGDLRWIFGVLQRLDLPSSLDHMGLHPDDPTEEDISRTLGPYMQGQLKRDSRFQHGLGVALFPACVNICAVWTSGGPEQSGRFTTSSISNIPHKKMEFAFHLLPFIPSRHVVSLQIYHSSIREELFVTMPNIKTLRLRQVTLSGRFLQPDPNGPLANRKLLPSLRYLRLEDVDAKSAGWEPLKAYLIHQTSGGQAISLRMCSHCNVSQMVVEEIRGLVEEFVCDIGGP